jgi:molybdate transport system substrate-binding protein
MATLRILSGGAAHGLVEALARQFEAATGYEIEGEFGAVGTMAAILRAGAPVDVLILTSTLIGELSRDGYVAHGTAIDVGVVKTAVAARTGDATPAIENADALKLSLLDSDEIYFPDPQQATAGIHFANVLRSLGIADETEPRSRTFPNGAAAMRALAASKSARPIGCTQVTEILNTPGVDLVGSLPPGYELATTYTAAVCAKAAAPAIAQEFTALLTSHATSAQRRLAGFD